MSQPESNQTVAELGTELSMEPFREELQPLIEEVLAETGKNKYRANTKLVPNLVVWLVLALTIRRELNCQQVLNWLLSGFRWLYEGLPAKAKLVADGAITHARTRMGAEVFKKLFKKQVKSFGDLEPDFHGYVTVIHDGTTATMPDSTHNRKEFGKPSSRNGAGAFPQMRIMALVVLSTRLVLNLSFAPYTGKGSGERALLKEILPQMTDGRFLHLGDRGLYDFETIYQIHVNQGQGFLFKIPKTVKPKFIERLPDGSYLATISKKMIDPENPKHDDGKRNRWITRSLTVRVIDVQTRGFQPYRLITSIDDTTISAMELVKHYHNRWDVEIAYDELKVHQLVTLRGQSPTSLRSKLPELVKQELYASFIMYNAIRRVIAHAAHTHHQDPRFISFKDALRHLIDAIPLLSTLDSEQRTKRHSYMLAVIADCVLSYPRRQRVSPRVVKVKMSKFKRKRDDDASLHHDFEADTTILEPPSPKSPLPALKPSSHPLTT